MNMLILLGTLLQLLTPINLKAYKENLEPFAAIDFFKIFSGHYDNLFEKLNLQALHIRRRHSGILLCNKRL
jgi:hypothetical protein